MAAEVSCAWRMCSMRATATCIRWCCMTGRCPGRRRWRWTFPIASCTCAWITAGRSRASMAWAGRSSRRWATCSPSRTWRRCSGCGARSIRRRLRIRTSCFRGRSLCGEKTGPYTPHPLEHGRRGGVLLDGHPVVDIEELAACAAGVGLCRAEDGRVAGAAGERRSRSRRCMRAMRSSAGCRSRSRARAQSAAGAMPVRADMVLNTRRLAGVREHRWQDLTATVGAGTPWAEMQRELAQHGQIVALDPLWPEQATVGGVMATNDSGALRLRYGSLRDLMIGMTIVLADGTIARTGGKVVKNVAGYDLHKLMTGAFGTLGVIAEVTFRLHPLPAHTRLWSCGLARSGCAGVSDDARCVDSRMSVRAMQLRASLHECALDIELASLPEVVAEQMERLNVLARGCGGTCEVQASSRQTCSRRGQQIVRPRCRGEGDDAAHCDCGHWCATVLQLGGTAVAQASGIMLGGLSRG